MTNPFEAIRPMRLVRAMLVDPDKNVPMDHRLVFDSKEEFTDSTDDELFFNEAVVTAVTEHNAYRSSLIGDDDKPLKDVRLHDLVSAVVMLAKF